jgi:hypothetical protein
MPRLRQRSGALRDKTRLPVRWVLIILGSSIAAAVVLLAPAAAAAVGAAAATALALDQIIA